MIKFSLGKELFKDALPIVEKFAPTVASIIGGPVGLGINFLVPILARSFGTSTNISDIVQQIINHPKSGEILKSIEDDNKGLLSTLNDDLGSLSKAEINVKLEWN